MPGGPSNIFIYITHGTFAGDSPGPIVQYLPLWHAAEEWVAEEWVAQEACCSPGSGCPLVPQRGDYPPQQQEQVLGYNLEVQNEH